MRRALLLALTACVLSACVAETVERRRPRKGPVKEVGFVDLGGGRVRYSAEGWGWAVASRRRLALRLMARNCGRELVPKITDEYTHQDADAAYSEADVTSNMDIGAQHYTIEHYVHLTYECRDPKAPEPVVSTTTVHAPVVVVPGIEVSTPAASVELSTPPVTVVPSSSTLPSPEPPK